VEEEAAVAVAAVAVEDKQIIDEGN